MPRFLLQSPFDDPSTKWILIGLAMLVIMYVVVRPLRSRSKSRDPLTRHGPSNLAQQRGVEREMHTLLVELSEMSRQITAQLDTRSAKLEVLIREADERIAALGQRPIDASRLPNSEPAQELPLPAEEAGARLGVQRNEPADPRHERIYQLADKGCSSKEIAHEVGQPSGEIELILALRPRA